MSYQLSLNGYTPKPFLKWAGGKSQLLKQFTRFYPRKFAAYYEPFVGSGAVYFHLYGLNMNGELGNSMTKVHLSDSNHELMNCYHVIRDRVNDLVAALVVYKTNHSKTHYYEVRSQDAESLNNVQRAARFIYLNKTCFNGLYRVNSKGRFNVPMGKYKNPAILDVVTLANVRAALHGVELKTQNFKKVLEHAKSGDFVYFDPPYHPLTSTSNFTSYTQDSFGEKQQRELADVVRELDRKGCKVMVSNSWTPLILDLYKHFDLKEVKASRIINSKSEKRGKISEVVVMNYESVK